jgi:diguanylate cyclase (GGDEF)-like protein
MRVAAYALIVEPDPARAAQYSYLIERRGIAPVVAKTGAEALSEVARLGPPALIVAEATLPDHDGLGLLSQIRTTVPLEAAQAVLIIGSRETYEAAARLMITLGISALLSRSHKASAFEQAIDRTLVCEVHQPVGPQPPPEPPSQALVHRAPDRIASDPRVQELAEMPGLRTLSGEELQRITTATAQVFGTAIALLWLDLGKHSFFELRLSDAVDASSPLRVISRWAPVRRLIGTAAIEVPDVAEHVAFARTPLLPGRSPAALAGAPLTLDGAVVGAVAIIQPRSVGRLPAGSSEALLVWAQRISADLERLRSRPRGAPVSRGPQVSGPPVSRGSSIVGSPSTALESLAKTIDFGFMISDDSGMVCFANPALSVHLGLGNVCPNGQTRAAVLRHLAEARGVEDGVVSAIVGASGTSPQELEFVVQGPDKVVLRWSGRSIDLHDRQGMLDEFSDVTRQANQARASEALARVDALTGLPNSAAIVDTLGRETARALRTGEPFSVAVFALDRVQWDNGMRGKEAFRNVAWTLRAAARRYDLAARLDHSRLLALISQATAGQARTFCERFMGEVRHRALPNLPPLTVSGGVAQFDGGRGIQELLADASAKLGEARRLGGDRIVG